MQDVSVINLSLASPNDDLGVALAVASAWQNDIVLVAAVGNKSTLNPTPSWTYPAASYSVIGVSGVKPDGSFANTSPCALSGGGYARSNYGWHVDLAAPFWALSTIGTADYEDETGGWCGTSMSTPHVTGVVALLRTKRPKWSNLAIMEHLYQTAAHPTLPPGQHDEFIGHGIVDAAAALDVPPPPTVYLDGPSELFDGEMGTFVAQAFGGAGNYSYDWTYRYLADGVWHPMLYTGDTAYGSFSCTQAQGSLVSVRVVVESGGLTSTALHSVSLQCGSHLKTGESLPESYALEANYPNPLDDQSVFHFALPEESFVRIVIYDLLGRELTRPIEDVVSAGRHGISVDATDWPSGSYIYRMEARATESGATFLDSRSMTVLH